MCSSALVETIECYMDDVVECFEDFVKKSLCVFTVGIGALVAVIFYLLKSFHERSSIPTLPAGKLRILPRNIIINGLSTYRDTQSKDSGKQYKYVPTNNYFSIYFTVIVAIHVSKIRN